MALTPTQLTALRSEIINDPTALGYAPHIASGSDNAIVDVLNLPRAGITIRRDNIMPNEVLEAIDTRDFATSITTTENSWFESVTQLRAIRLSLDDGNDTVVLGNLKRLLQNPGPQGSRARIVALSNRQGSRAEQLFGRNVTVTAEDVGLALTPRP